MEGALKKYEKYGLYVGVALFLITTIILSIHLVKTMDEKKTLQDSLTVSEAMNKTLETDLKTAKARVVYKKVYYPASEGGGLQEESGESETDVSEAVSKAIEQYSSENERLTEENAELKKWLELKSDSVSWAFGANADLPVWDEVKLNSVRGTRKIIRVLGMETWAGLGWDFNVKKTQLCADVKF